MRWPDSLDIGNDLGGIGSSSVYQRDNLTQATGVLTFTTGLFMYLPAENDARLNFLRNLFL